jgi:hypothetical protein
VSRAVLRCGQPIYPQRTDVDRVVSRLFHTCQSVRSVGGGVGSPRLAPVGWREVHVAEDLYRSPESFAVEQGVHSFAAGQPAPDADCAAGEAEGMDAPHGVPRGFPIVGRAENRFREWVVVPYLKTP